MRVHLPGFLLLLLFTTISTVAQTPLNIKVNFQDSKSTPPSGWLKDIGESYGTRTSGHTFGWERKSDQTPVSLTQNGRKRSTPSDILLATFMHMQGNDAASTTITPIEGIWEASAANGSYNVTVSVGESDNIDSKHTVNVEGISAISSFQPTTSAKFKSATVNVSVSDGRITLDATGGINTKINYVTIAPASSVAAPSVTVTSPVANQSFTAPASILLKANASASDATIKKVEFFNGSTLLNTQVTAPYEYTWQNVAAGSYTISARATDSKGNITTSSPVPVTVSSGSGTAPTINITTPVANQNFTPPAAISISANATAVNATVTKVEFFNGTTVINTQQTAPYDYTWQNVPAGSYTLTARATDSKGLSTTSAPISITVSSGPGSQPTINVTAPIPNQNFAPPATINITANATAPNATVSKVEFYNGSTLLNTQRTAPYAYSWQNVPAGNYTITAKVTDSKNVVATSPPIPITVSTNKRPSVVSVNPASGSSNVSVNTSVSTNILTLPNSGIDNNTLTSANVYLSTGGVKVASNVNGTGGGDAITLVPSVTLKSNTTYTFTITSGVKDLSGASFMPYSSTFTTGSTVTPPSTTIKFTKTPLPASSGEYTALAVGKDRKLYALTVTGVIHRFPINADGTLGSPQLIYSLQDSGGVRKERLAVGMAFDPTSTAANPILWVTYCRTGVFVDAPDWDGKLTKLSGANLQTVKDILINLPRSAKDHVTNGIAFGADNALYISQGSTSGMGMADNIWGNRAEHLLNAAVLRLDPAKITTFPLNVKTADGGGSYNPYSSTAPLTIYASGVRNAYNLVWHSNGSLYAATNGSAPGSNTPASVNGTRRPDGSLYNGPAVPALINVQQTQFDYLFNVVKGGYYGHPNPTRGEYVMNGGNPTTAVDKAELPAYPVGTQPDANWRGSAFDFRNNASPDGALEYKSNTFGGALKGKLLIVRYSAHDDIITLTLNNTTRNVSSFLDGTSIPGFSGFIDPLALVEDLTNGNIYVSEYGGKKITLLKPDLSTSKARQSAPPDTTTYPNPEFVSGDYHNVNSSCDDIDPVAVKRNPTGTFYSAVNPFGRIRISPNPAVKKFTLSLSNNEFTSDIKVQIVNTLGTVHEIEGARLNGSSLEVDVTRLSLKPGVYFLKLISKKGDSEILKLILL